ncbi:phosphoglycerate mutase-like protein [Cristinia sonorae]|uniref:Phosphoglycerate mutase-like protein n=1 Tax=Cristinia sonorae TaxID=1940300 RepID=A0A8K0UG75_9AGAR|nr:phosphoglycerate mutase-like protein [Cristinia sonorae]
MAVPAEQYGRSFGDLEAGEEYKRMNSERRESYEQEALLSPKDYPNVPEPTTPQTSSKPWICTRTRVTHVVSFFAGVLACAVAQYFLCGSGGTRGAPASSAGYLASPDAGSTEVHQFPPPSPTNAFPSLFPTSVGYAGPTPTGAEPGLIQTAPAYPLHTGAPHLVSPSSFVSKHNSSSSSSSHFDLFKHWGNLSPWFSVGKGTFGVDSTPEAPETCQITGLHFLHRHGARYPTGWAAYGGPANFSSRLHNSASKWETHGALSFMNDWTYKLGEEVLTPFGRQQLFDLGVSMRTKYGYLLKDFTETNKLPVFRTESQDRMLASALNFAIGFFGYPFEGQYQQSITIEADGFNNTLAPYKTCPNANSVKRSSRSLSYVRQWADIYLADAHARLAPLMKGYSLTIEDVYTFQQMCAYETVAIGYSKFCELFTEEEWKGFDYALDLFFWYDSAFGSPVARVQGIGYVQEMLARLTHTPISLHNSSTNATLDDNPVTFPLDHSLYVDATHEVVVLNIITALNLTNFAADGPLPADHIPKHRSFKVSHLAPFATNVQFQHPYRY